MLIDHSDVHDRLDQPLPAAGRVAIDLARRRWLQGLGAAVALGLACRATAAVDRSEGAPILGAIRWDAWYDPDGNVGRVVEDSLGPEAFHSRMPFFGQEIDNTHVRIDGYDQTSFDQEISYAQSMGLNYWAYCWYEDGSPLRRAWELHQKSIKAQDMNWCLLWQLSHLGGRSGFTKAIPDFLRWMAQANYQKIGGAPLVYLYLDSDSALNSQWGGDMSVLAAAFDDLRAAIRAADMHMPHVVILNGDPTKAAAALRQVQGAAISNYIGWIPADQPAPFAKLLQYNRIFWDKMAATGVPVVPIVMTGWDTRPRKLHPPPWDKRSAEQTLATRNTYVTPGTNEEIDNAIRTAESYVENHRDVCPSNLVLIYSWDECDEGGGALVSKSYLAGEHHLR